MTTLRIAALALLAVAATPRGGCDGAKEGAYDPCAGKACGDRCTICPPGEAGCLETADVKACDASGACVSTGPLGCGSTGACAGKACGAPCNSCDTPACETFAATACDPSGQCVTATPALCGDPCAGKACGASCTYDPPCRYSRPPCMMPSYVGQCDASGACIPGAATCTPANPCAGKSCGDDCSLCGSVPCMSPVRTVCDLSGACVPWASTVCYDACAGKQCGDACQVCPPDATDCASILCVTACDGAGKCGCAGGGAACP